MKAEIRDVVLRIDRNKLSILLNEDVMKRLDLIEHRLTRIERNVIFKDELARREFKNLTSGKIEKLKKIVEEL